MKHGAGWRFHHFYMIIPPKKTIYREIPDVPIMFLVFLVFLDYYG
jgi:hypothetical protein